MKTPLLVADSVGKSFGGRRVLSSATLRAVPGEVRVVLGRSGVGKSTLMAVAAGWLSPDTGTVRMSGVAFEHARLSDLARRGIFYLPDDGVLSAAMTVREQLELLRVRYDGAPVDAAAVKMGIGVHLDRRPHTLSGGEQRRADLTAVLVRKPTCLLADEPLRGIAPIDAEALMREFRGLAASGVAVVITGHDVPPLLDGADHVTWCTSGTTYELGAPAAALRHDAFRREYLGLAA